MSFGFLEPSFAYYPKGMEQYNESSIYYIKLLSPRHRITLRVRN